MLERRPFKRRRNGTYAVKLSEQERAILHELPGEVIRLLESEEGDQSTFRLFPRAYENDLGRQVEYDRLMRDDLATRHIEALTTLQASADAHELDEEQIDSWVKGLNQLRLILGTRLDISEDTVEEDFEKDPATASAYALYGYLGLLQDAAVEAMSEAYPD